jgi:murein DD-endopeptidase MepM/ murein hydrolase activator NlpD
MAATPPWVADLLSSSLAGHAGTYRLPAAGGAPEGAGGVGAHLPRIRSVAGRYGLDPSLLAGVVDFESSGNPRAINKSSGATGLGQVMPRERGFPDRPTQAELLDPDTNLDWSARILKSGLDRYGSEDKALAAYLGAIDARGNITGAVDANGTGGNQYIRTVRERQQRYRDTGPGGATGPAVATGDAPPWVRDLVDRGPPVTNPQQAGIEAMRAREQTDGSAPPWVRELLSTGSVGAAGARPAAGVAGYQGPAQTDEIWPVAGQRWGAVNNPFGAGQSRAAGTSVALPAQNVGADLTARYGAPVVAPVSGTVVETFDAPDERDRNANHGWGGMTLLRGDNGYYYRLSHAQPGSIATRPGQRVAQGQRLQNVGLSGNTTGAHLDAEKFSTPGRFEDIAAGRGAGGPRGSAAPGRARPAQPTGGPLPAWVRDAIGAT